jgi:hypothetical protein
MRRLLLVLVILLSVSGETRAQLAVADPSLNDEDVGTCMQQVRLTDRGFIWDGDAENVRPWRDEDLLKAHDWCQSIVAEQTRTLGADVMACLRFERITPFGAQKRPWTSKQLKDAISHCQKSVTEQTAKIYAAIAAETKRRQDQQ